MTSSRLSPKHQNPDSLRAPTVSRSGARKWIYPKRLDGRYSRLRKKLAFLLILIYIAVPYLSVGDLPLLRLNFGDGVVYFFGETFRFHDATYLVLIFLIMAFTLFFTTAIRGRLWCGFACPQTVFVEWVIRPLEEFIEGNANHRRVADKKPLSVNLALRKGTKHFLFLLIAAGLANVLIAYAIPPQTLLEWMVSSPALHPGPFVFMLTVSLIIYWDLAWFREQFCSFLCPYARFQSVMLDQRTPTVTYDFNRGEPRGKREKGDCIDCQLCKRVCPTGIDIRDGLQLECIQCCRCMDACDMVMKNLHRPLGLIRIDSQTSLDQRGEKQATVRPRPLIYGAILAVLIIGTSIGFIRRQNLDVTIIRQPGTTFSQFDSGEIGNLFLAKVINQTQKKQYFQPKVKPNELCQIKIVCGRCKIPIAPLKNQTFPIMILSNNAACSHVTLMWERQEKALPLLSPIGNK